MNTKQLIEDFFAAEEALWKAFGYVEDWKVIPMDDKRDYYWSAITEDDADNTSGVVRFAETVEDLLSDDQNYYENEIYAQCFLPKYIYRTDEYTMISVDTHTDGNKFLQIFDNSKEVKQCCTLT